MLPIATWLPACSARTVRADLLAGIALAGLLIPEGMAYAGIAGVPPEAGLFSAAAGLFVYALFGSSRHLAVSPTSGSAALLAAVVAPLALGDPGRHMALASATAVVVGLIFFVGRMLRVGFAAEFVSKPVLKGFVFGLALTIIAKQVPTLIGLAPGHGDFFAQAWHVVSSLGQANAWTVGVGAAALAVAFGLGTVAPRVPSALVVFVLGVVATPLFGLERHGVEVVGAIRTGLPHLGLPAVTRAALPDIVSAALGIALIVEAEALTAGREFAARFQYRTDPNQELFALGAANLASGLAQGIVVGGGMSGTAANAAGGARTPVSAITAAALAVLTLGFLMPLFRGLPEAVLAAIVIHAVAHLADVGELRRFGRLRTGGVWFALVALTGVLFLGLLRGLIGAVALTLIALMQRLVSPRDSTLGRIPGTTHYANIEDHPEAEQIPGILIFRPDGPLFFANASRVFDALRDRVRGAAAPVHTVVFDLEASRAPDVTVIDALDQLRAELAGAGVTLRLARVADPFLDVLKLSGFLSRLGADRVYWGIEDAVRAAAASASPLGADPR